jgi:hypothetical protein
MEVYPLIGESAIVAFAVGSTFLSRTDYDVFYYLVMMAAAWWQIERTELAASPEKAAAAVSARAAFPAPALPAPRPPVIGPAHARTRHHRPSGGVVR